MDNGVPAASLVRERGASDGSRMAGTNSKQVMSIAVGVAIAHGLNDAYSAFLHPLLPRIMTKLGLSIALAAALATTLSLAASLLQPVLGYVADRGTRRLFVVMGPVFSAVFMSLIGVAPSFGTLVILLALGGLGSAAFHPPGASMAVRLSEGKGSGVRYSLFSFGGSLGYASGPLIAVGLVEVLGLNRLWLAMIPMLLIAPILLAVLPRAEVKSTSPPPTLRGIATLLAGPLGLVFGISALSTFVQRVFLTMEPIAASAAGASEAVGAVALSAYLVGQAGGSLLGGWLADRMDRRILLAGLTLFSLPAHIASIAFAPGSAPALVSSLLAGCATMAILPAIVVIAQEIMPTGAAVGSGIVMGLAWAAGSIGVLGTGVLGDLIGARNAALVCTPALLGATLLALHPALRAHGRPLSLQPEPALDGPR
jgi:MFS transporter, FSR family, fosmidomycin resistance protein